MKKKKEFMLITHLLRNDWGSLSLNSIVNYFRIILEKLIFPLVDFTVSKQPTTSRMRTDVLVFPHTSLDDIGKDYGKGKSYCCYSEMIKDGKCQEKGVIVDPKAKLLYRWAANWYNSSTDSGATNVTSLSIPERQITINDSAVYYVWVMSCGDTDDDKQGEVSIVGTVTIRNIYGYLPGEQAPLEVLYWVIFVFSTIWLGIWGALCCKFREGMMRMQHVITAVLVLGVLENLFYASSLAGYNVTGRDNLALNVFVFLITTAKSTISFIGLLLVGMGYTVTKPTLPKNQVSVVTICGFVYFGVFFMWQCLNMLYNTSQTQELNVPYNAVVLFLVLTIIMDFVFLGLIYFYLFKSLISLKPNKGSKKYTMFRNVAILLGVFYLLSILLFIIQLAASANGKEDAWWKGWFFFTGYWNIIYFIISVFISFLWRPSPNNARYAWSSQIDDTAAPPQVVELDNADGGFRPYGSRRESSRPDEDDDNKSVVSLESSASASSSKGRQEYGNRL
eukprot:TRINITY_DN3455_c0_g1_i1.p1 TRINITY_DN3455_c0_g1~~TRINITY_DN3455_c0_g1_i1.p1  ORF type:complete len:505 (+),score=116.46 TRINITY_DN3455_c0_g1_i1:161-1675(+)